MNGAAFLLCPARAQSIFSAVFRRQGEFSPHNGAGSSNPALSSHGDDLSPIPTIPGACGQRMH